MAETNENGASISQEEDVFEKYSGVAESFQSDTRRYLMEHLLDEYGNVGQAVSYNLIQNVADNRKEGEPLRIKFEVSTKDKRFRFICSGTTGVTDWERYNSLHREGVFGIARRGEGAKVLIPIANSVRTETKRLDDSYVQSIWKENQIWRSDIAKEKDIFVHFPPSALSPGSTVITAYGLFDEVGDRKAGMELSNGKDMARTIMNDWWLFLRENPDVSITYEVDGEAIDIKPWELPELEDSKKYESIEVLDHKGRVIGKIEKAFIGLAKAPLKDAPPPAIAFSTGTHIVTYQTVYSGPNSSKCFGYVKAPFLLSSETSNHFGLKSTSAWRLVREKLLYLVGNFMSGHLGAMESLSQKDLKAITDVTDQINKLIADRFPDWHPGGGYKPKKKKPERPQIPFIRKAATDMDRYLPGATCNLSFEIINPDRTGPSWRLEARVKVVSPSGKEVYHKTWKIELANGEVRSISDLFAVPEDAEIGSHLVRFSLVDDTKNELIDEHRVSFEVGEEVEEEEEQDEETPREKPPKREGPKKREKKTQGPFALKPCLTATFPVEEGVIRESYFDGEENRVILNDAAPTFELSLQNTINWKYHVARCMIEELARLKLNKDINILEPDEVTREKCFIICEDIKTTKSTFMSEWAKLLEKTPKGKS
jgi:hypothetical protein